jgi:cellulose biosynthesis protein BcsQ
LYVITFYSFKGGVGRTMALVNVAAELVRRGRKVLVVDFDLEAPGLETYKHLRPPKPAPGIVEYVTEFRRTQEVPNLLDHIYETKPIGKKGGRLWVMPAGRRDRAYRSALASLDWQRLYQAEGGFLLFEDLKKGWEEELKPDYVLVDSRTGDTDVLGICTRQLPHSVVLMFTPNEQNLAGLENVCQEIRREATEGLKKPIRLHFVAANVPDLDDENRILRRHMNAFRDRLGFQDLSSLIRRYENLEHLDQSIFTLTRPHSKLARSYRRLIRTLLKDNSRDREGALFFLQDYPERHETRDHGSSILVEREGEVHVSDEQGYSGPSKPQLEDKNRLHEIARYFHNDPEILSRVAKSFILEKDYRNAVRILDLILSLDPNRAESLFHRAVCKTNLIETDEAAEDLLACLRVLGLWKPTDKPVLSTSISPLMAKFEHRGLQAECLARLCVMAPAKLAKLADMIETHEIQGLELWRVVPWLCRREEGVPIAARLLRNALASKNETGQSVRQLDLLRARCWREVIQLHETRTSEADDAESLLALALAHWGEDEEMPESLCRQALAALERDQQSIRDVLWSWGYHAFALLYWRTGMLSEALECLEKAEQNAHAETEEIVSLWWLREESVQQYLDDCQLFRRMFQGEPLRPAFLGPSSPPTPS